MLPLSVLWICQQIRKVRPLMLFLPPGLEFMYQDGPLIWAG